MKTAGPTGFCRDNQEDFGDRLMGYFQFRRRVHQMKKIKTATNPAAISIQYWPSKPSNAKRLIRNCTVPVPNFGQNKQFVCAT
jgi:hypothetical protein